MSVFTVPTPYLTSWELFSNQVVRFFYGKVGFEWAIFEFRFLRNKEADLNSENIKTEDSELMESDFFLWPGGSGHRPHRLRRTGEKRRALQAQAHYCRRELLCAQSGLRALPPDCGSERLAPHGRHGSRQVEGSFFSCVKDPKFVAFLTPGSGIRDG